MVSLRHAKRKSATDQEYEEWKNSILNNGIKPGDDGRVYLYDPEKPPDDSLKQYPSVIVDVPEEALKVNWWFSEDGSVAPVEYKEWDESYHYGTEFIVETSISPENILAK